ncbi:CARDB domain-containing protein [Natrinema altunense]|uniref:CARDB domain-containing protein n=1 Tax=Natrinema altunense (strain JCM 12890 / CGMCC 1.3731 / AJ2) TaxID=1227494 RepID=L9ZEI0_NATA2|nr:CARDB domain-containing protein [Natrinema altunense]ELY83568.1 hypothetical protein C485_17487 [Natrinema altunense JCM 12890]
MKSYHYLLVATLLVSLIVPTAALTMSGDNATEDVVLESGNAANGQYAAIENGKLGLDLEALNDRSVTRADDVFRITVTDDAVERIWIDHDVPGLTFYRNDQPTATVSEARPLEPSAGTVARIGVAVDTHIARSGTETFTVTVQYADNETMPGGSAGGSSGSPPAESTAIGGSALELSPTTVEAGETVTVTATYRNDGETTTSSTVALTVDGTVVDQRTITLEPGESQSVTFERSMEWPGTYDVGIEGVGSASVTVDGPAADIVNATVVDPDITAGESTTIEATVENPTDERATRTLEMAVDGIVVDSRAVSIPANGERTVTFERRFDESGTYEIAVNAVSAGTVSVERAAFSIRDRELSPATTAALAPPATAGLLVLVIAANRRWAFLR